MRIYSDVTTGRECGISPLRYVEWPLEELQLAGDPAVADRYLPWSYAVPASVRITGPRSRRFARPRRS